MLIPNRFITLDRDTGKAYVYKMVNGQPALQAVELGLRNERESEVLAGLDVGDALALVTQTASSSCGPCLVGAGAHAEAGVPVVALRGIKKIYQMGDVEVQALRGTVHISRGNGRHYGAERQRQVNADEYYWLPGCAERRDVSD